MCVKEMAESIHSSVQMALCLVNSCSSVIGGIMSNAEVKVKVNKVMMTEIQKMTKILKDKIKVQMMI